MKMTSMIRSSRGAKFVAALLAATAHGAVAVALMQPSPAPQMEGASGGEAALGSSFADMAAGTLSAEPPEDVTEAEPPAPVKAAPPQEITRAEPPQAVQPEAPAPVQAEPVETVETLTPSTHHLFTRPHIGEYFRVTHRPVHLIT